MRLIFNALIALAFAGGLSSMALANELDNESSVTNKQLQGTLVLRVDTRTHETSLAKTPATLRSKKEAMALAKAAKFASVPAGKMRSELDQDGGTPSWYFYNPYGYNSYNYYYQPNCYWYGNYYQPYYTYNYGYYNYYYYNSWWSYGR